VKLLVASSVSVIVFFVLAAGFVLSHVFFAAPQRGTASVEIRVNQGEPLAAVLRKLQEERVISNHRIVALWARLTGVEKRIHWGLYRFEPGLAPREVLDRLVLGKGVFHTVTIPEGLTVREIADILGKLQIADSDKFLAETHNPEILASLGLQDKGVEGYLFPDTYHFTPETPEREMLLAMAERFRKRSEPLLEQNTEQHRLSSHQLITLASIIEKETGIEAERPLISAVFHNRLKRGMPLQSDPTVIYGLKNFDGNLTRKDLQHPTPYNTYRIAALPPGPICNPGISSIKAALNPADVPYLYFVSRNDGTHRFSEKFEAHKEAVKAYQPLADAASARRKAVPSTP
jgi:UPF0755 protein